MAIFHLDCKNISRETHKNFMACTAYRSADKITDKVTGECFDFSKKKRGVAYSALLFPHPEINMTRQELWDLVQQTETRKNARYAKEIEVSLPHELNDEQRKKLILEFSSYLIKTYGVAIDVNIHRPPHKQDSDSRNHHAHILMTTRSMNEYGTLGNKTPLEMADRDLKKFGLKSSREQIKEIRKEWANIVNKHLQLAGIKEMVSEKSYKEQGIGLLPKPKFSRKEQYLMKKEKEENLPEGLQIKKEMLRVAEQHNKLMEKNNEAKARYIKGLLSLFSPNKKEKYQIELHHTETKKHIPKPYKLEQITGKTVGYLFARNNEGYQIYFRSQDPHVVIIDDVKEIPEKKELLPNVAVETSPQNWHFWFKIPEKYSENDCRLIQNELIFLLQGDRAAKGINRNTRLPFFKNKKNDPVKKDFVTKLTYASKENFVNFEEILNKAKEREIAEFNRTLEIKKSNVSLLWKKDKNLHEIFMKGYQNNFCKTADYSNAELAGAIAAIGNGADPELVKEYLQDVLTATEKDRSRKSKDYIERTVNKALERLMELRYNEHINRMVDNDDNTPKMS